MANKEFYSYCGMSARRRFEMNVKVAASIAFAGFILCSGAHASVVTSYFCFGPDGCNSNGTPITNGTPKQVTDGTAFNGTAGGTISVYGDQANSAGTFGTPVLNYNSSTQNGLFEVSDKYNNHGVGIAPYNPAEGTSNGTFSSQDGLTDSVPNKPTGTNNFMLLDLTNVAYGSTVSLLLQAGVTGDTFDVYRGSTSTPTAFSGTTMLNSSPISVDESGTSMPNGTSAGQGYQFSFTKTTAGIQNQWIAISADCHYLLLDEIKVSTSAVPEPRFYGLLMAGLLGIAGIYARKRRVAPEIA
jgi:hypothetical protein